MTLIVAVSGLGAPLSARTTGAALAGTVSRADDHAPLTGARVWAADSRTAAVYPSSPTDAEGAFAFASLPASTYRLGVEVDGSLFPVETSLALVAGEARRMSLEVDPDAPPDPAGPAAGGKTSATPSLWSNPLTAALLVLGAAVVVGLLVESATDDELPASPF